MMQTNTQPELAKIASCFQIESAPAFINSFGSGHINDTYAIRSCFNSEPEYLLQRVNQKIFTDVPALMNNIALVTLHLRARIRSMQPNDGNMEVLRLIRTIDHRNYYVDVSGNYWRMYSFVQNARSVEVVETPGQAFEGGNALGKFQAMIFDLDSSLLYHTIPDFHDIGIRLTRLNTALANDRLGRKQGVAAEIEFIQKRIAKMCTILNLGKTGRLPVRITHNDTKFNNFLLDEQGRTKCIVDLDTVMPGFVAYDFGDAVRTIINTGAEDEKDLRRIGINLSLFEAFTNGYLKAAASFLTEVEIQSLSLGVLLFPYMQGVRFLTDYMNGDLYYKIDFDGHNLQRARAQFQLLKLLEGAFADIERIISQCVVAITVENS